MRRLSVCHVPILCRNGLACHHTFFSGTIILVLLVLNCKIRTGSLPTGGGWIHVGYINFAIFCHIFRVAAVAAAAAATKGVTTHKCFLPVKKLYPHEKLSPSWNLCWRPPLSPRPHSGHCQGTTITDVSSPVKPFRKIYASRRPTTVSHIFPPCEKLSPSWNLCSWQSLPTLMSHMFPPRAYHVNDPPPLYNFTNVTSCTLLTRDLLAIAKFPAKPKLIIWNCISWMTCGAWTNSCELTPFVTQRIACTTAISRPTC